jgi:hypothetical protein
VKVYDTKNETIWRAPKKWCKFMTPEVVPEALKRFVSSNPADETGSDGALAEAVYGAALVQLEELKAWYVNLPNLQTIYILLNVFYDLLGMCDFRGQLSSITPIFEWNMARFGAKNIHKMTSMTMILAYVLKI